MNSTTAPENHRIPSLSGKRILVTGASGFVGRNLLPLLERSGAELVCPSHRACDLLEQEQIRQLLSDGQPHVVIHLAGLIGGVLANKERPADFCYQNLVMNTMILHESWRAGVGKYLTLIGGCSYPATASGPISESSLFSGYPQSESAPYSLAKAMSVIQAQSYRMQFNFDAIVLVPGNLYGPYDNFSLESSHVIPALIRKFHQARASGEKTVVAWGTGKPVRDFVYVVDACEAIVRALENYTGPEIINISSGIQTSIRELVETIAALIGYNGTILWDESKPDGQLHKVFDVTRMRERLGYICPTSLREGLQKTVDWFETNRASARLGDLK